MSSPAASAPLAVLVLAWDETTPAARVVVEAADLATSYADSVVALVPTGSLTDELSQEEFLPLEASPTSVATPGEPLAKTLAKSDTAAVSPATAEAAPATPMASQPGSPPEPDADTIAPPLPATAPASAALVKPALVWQEVRVLHFSSHPNDYSAATLAHYSGSAQPALILAEALSVPAAPYLGSSEPLPVAQGNLPAEGSAVAAALLAATATAASALVALRTLGPPAAGAVLPASETPIPTLPGYSLAELPAAPDAESDTGPTPTTDELTLPNEASIAESSEEAAAKEAFTATIAPAQTEQPTRQPAPTSPAPAIAEPEPHTPDDTSDFGALRPAPQAFDAPNLNFQIIQYARLAVPQALSKLPFGAIYAPAWPTWLAAQELRHRSGQPLVVHLAQLAAADDELIDLAAGWPAEIQRQVLHRADLILTETPALAQRLRRELALPTHRVRCIPAADAAAVAQALRTAQRQ